MKKVFCMVILCGVIGSSVFGFIQTPRERTSVEMSYELGPNRLSRLNYGGAYGITKYWEIGLSGRSFSQNYQQSQSFSVFLNFNYHVVIGDLKVGRSFISESHRDPNNELNSIQSTGGDTTVSFYIAPHNETRPFVKLIWSDLSVGGESAFSSSTYYGVLHHFNDSWDAAVMTSSSLKNYSLGVTYYL